MNLLAQSEELRFKRKEVTTMYYVKTRINDELEVKIDLTGDNIFTTCPECGAEFPIDIIEMAQVEHFDFYSTRFTKRYPRAPGKR